MGRLVGVFPKLFIPHRLSPPFLLIDPMYQPRKTHLWLAAPESEAVAVSDRLPTHRLVSAFFVEVLGHHQSSRPPRRLLGRTCERPSGIS